MVCRCGNDSERLHPERREPRAESTETSHCTSAERTVHSSKQTEEYRAATEEVTERHIPIPICRGQYEAGRAVAWSYRGV